MPALELWWIPVLILTGFLAGLVDSMAGGGGMITLPVLLSLGLPPTDALGTNKLQSSFGSASSTFHYARGGLIDLQSCVPGILFTLAGAALGSTVTQLMRPEYLAHAIIVLLVICLVYTLFKPKLGAEDIHPRMSRLGFYALFGILLGFYDGFFGPGTGAFWAMAFMLGLGYNLTRATAHTKAMNFTSNITSLVVFILGGHVVYKFGLLMGCGQMFGARVGSKLVMKRGSRFVRPIFITAVSILIVRLIYLNFLKN
jgi:uncharacterized protein